MRDIMLKGLFVLVVAVVAAILLLPNGLDDLGKLNNEPAAQQETPEAETPEELTARSVAKRQAEEGNLRDMNKLYELNENPDVVTMYLTVSRGNDAENTNHSWEEINTYSVYDYDRMGVPRYQVTALVQEGDELGPLPGRLGYGETVPNATVQIRGQISSKNNQKNFKVQLKKGKEEWNEQRTIALNKHQSEGLRFRNKLCFDLMAEVDPMMSLRTQFVHLYVKDLTDGESDEFVDYGLFTQVEQLNKTALRAHGLSKYGKLYKINEFEFYRYADVIRLTSDPEFDPAAMEVMLENKTDSDNADLIEMLEAVNDPDVSVDELFETYFDEENIAYWMAFQILVGNVDTQNRNMYLYSPAASKKWYIYSWDNDGALMGYENELKNRPIYVDWEFGVGNYWGNVLFQRLLRSGRFRAALDDAVNDLRATVLTRKNIAQKAAKYAGIVKPYVYAAPDLVNAPINSEQYDQVVEHLPDEIDRYYQSYLESLEKPMPFYIGTPETKNGKLLLSWDAAYDFDAETIRYSVEVSDNCDFSTTIMKQEDVLIPETEMEMLPPGQYFLRVLATNESGKTQPAFDYYVTRHANLAGMICFYVRPDGSIERDIYVEN